MSANNSNNRNQDNRIASARESFSGRLMTDAQFDEAMALTGILEREIQKSGAFKEKLGDYAFAFARTERFDAMKAETILRDLFKERTGQSMNQMRETLADREKDVTEEQRNTAYQRACDIGPMIEKGDKMSFNRAYAHQANLFAREVGITDAGAKFLMKEEFKAVEGSELYDWGKEIEERFYRPQIEAEKQQRESGQGREASRDRTRPQDRDGDQGQPDSSDDAPARRGTQRSRSRMDYRR
jgi:hypothetical protein